MSVEEKSISFWDPHFIFPWRSQLRSWMKSSSFLLMETCSYVNTWPPMNLCVLWYFWAAFQTNTYLSVCVSIVSVSKNGSPELQQGEPKKKKMIKFSLFYLRERDMLMVRSAPATNYCLRVCSGKGRKPNSASQNIIMSNKVEDRNLIVQEDMFMNQRILE